MEIVFHLGAHCTDEGLLLRSILRNRARLSKAGVLIPGPSRYRELLGAVSTTLRGDYASPDTEEMLVEEITDDETANRLVLSNDNFLCRPTVAITSEGFYPKAEKSAWLRRCFPSHDVHFAIALCNPAEFVSNLSSTLNADERAELLSSLPSDQLSWADVIAEIVEANPKSEVTVWAHEDAPFIWPDLMHELTGFDIMEELDGAFDMVEQNLSSDGVTRLRDFLTDPPELSEEQLRKTLVAFLSKHGAAQAPSSQFLPDGWTDETVTDLEHRYKYDLRRIATMPQVTLIEP